MNECMYRKNIAVGSKVAIVLKKDQKAGILTTGIVKKIMLLDGSVGRVKHLIN